ncbi:uncharacterized protein LOC118734340 [Rhagoletis pomonella]|uniref:uncharacterized protein LOC118734340 n=1 Tax=Rhagoletis pomonella TaxID=28610 RepID=UPI00177E57A0|nr:uncharacterized protein LOC118734340 [Rhagoletis pomonella]
MTVFLLGKTTICHIIHETCAALYAILKDEFLKIPSTTEEWVTVADRFEQRWNFPNCCGALDGKHIAIQAPAHCGSEYFNYKKFNSIVLMAMVDADYKFLFVEVGAYGRESDGGVFARCPLSAALADNSINFPTPRPLPHEADPMPFAITSKKCSRKCVRHMCIAFPNSQTANGRKTGLCKSYCPRDLCPA